MVISHATVGGAKRARAGAPGMLPKASGRRPIASS